MKKHRYYLLVFVLSVLFVPTSVLAHTGEENKKSNYKVETTQTPLSPFVGEKVEVTFTLEDETGKAAEGVNGTFLIKKTTVKEYVEKDAEVGNELVYEESGTTDASGNVSVSYAFTKEGMYDVEYVWGTHEGESAGHEILARDPTSYFLPEELMKRIWLFVGIAFAGMLVGALGMFILLTTTLHPKK